MNTEKHLVSTNDDSTLSCSHLFSNECPLTVSCYWIDEKGNQILYNTLKPGHQQCQQTYTTHRWGFKVADGQTMIGTYVGPSQRISFLSDEEHQAKIELLGPMEEHQYQPKPEWGEYRHQATSRAGIEIWSFDLVQQEAHIGCVALVDHMLRDAKAGVIRRLVEGKCKVSIIGRDQVTTDIPEHSYLKLQRGGRDLDSTTRGLGGSKELPVASVGEENITMVNDSYYPMENILIHEFGHSVMLIGMSDAEKKRVHDCYEKAKSKNMYSAGIYMIENADEYWAEGVQSWFDATIRTDVNDGHNTRSKLKLHDPDLSLILAETLGDGSWRFPQTAPCPLRHKKRQRDETSVPSPAVEMDRTSLLSRWEIQTLPCASLSMCSPVTGSRYFLRSCFGSLFSSAGSIKRM